MDYCGNGSAVETDNRARRELDLEHVVLDRADGGVEAAGGDDLVAGAQGVLHRHLRVRALALGADEQKPPQDQQRDDDYQDVQLGTSGAAWSLASAASL